MVVLGIVGGIASGKSLVSRELARLGAEVIDADHLGHEALREPAVKAALRERYGNQVFDATNEIDRRALAGIVFAQDEAGRQNLRHLEQLSHPRISSHMRERIGELATLGAVDVVVLDAALLLEAEWDQYCDQILFIDTPPETRLARAAQRGWTAADFAAREAAQLGLEEKRRRASVVIDNAGAAVQTLRQVHQFWKNLHED